MQFQLSTEGLRKAFARLEAENRRLESSIQKLELRGRPAKVLRERQARVIAALNRHYANR